MSIEEKEKQKDTEKQNEMWSACKYLLTVV